MVGMSKQVEQITDVDIGHDIPDRAVGHVEIVGNPTDTKHPVAFTIDTGDIRVQFGLPLDKANDLSEALTKAIEHVAE